MVGGVGAAHVAPEGIDDAVWEALEGVHDPEIPPCSITDLGMVERVAVSDCAIEVDLLPTFAGCPALDMIHDEATVAVCSVAGGRDVMIRFVYSPPWTSDRISEGGREALRGHGISPPGERVADAVVIPLAALGRKQRGMACPFCGSAETVLESAFGPTLCRSTHFCRACRNPFEGFKPK